MQINLKKLPSNHAYVHCYCGGDGCSYYYYYFLPQVVKNPGVKN